MKSLPVKLSETIIFQLARFGQALFYRCDLCLQPCHQYSLLCRTCASDLQTFDLTELHANLLMQPKVSRLLGKVRFEQLLCLAPYQWPYDKWISELKYARRIELSRLLGQLFSQHLQAHQANLDLPQVLIPVPLHPLRYKTRQYNQAQLLCDEIGKGLAIPRANHLLERVRHTKSQVGQSGVERRRNLKGAFELNQAGFARLGPGKIRHIGLVDDVLTTGSTVNEICRLLKKHGVEKITVLSVCLVINT